MRAECEKYHGRMREICEGSADLSIEQINRWRGRQGLDSLEEGTRASRIKHAVAVTHGQHAAINKSNSKPKSGCKGCRGKTAAKPNGVGPGSQLLKLWDKMPHCDACLALAAKMDVWGQYGCRKHLDEIVADIEPRAVAWMEEKHAWAHAVLPGIVERTAIRWKIRQDVEKAIGLAQAPPQPVVQKRPSIKARSRRSSRPISAGSAFRPAKGVPAFVTSQHLVADTLALLPQLPPDITQVAGVSRSGVYPATLLAMHLHVPLVIVRHKEGDWIEPGNGWRLLEGGPKKQGRTLAVDDTTMTGNSLRRTQEILSRMPGEKLFASIYCNPAAKLKPDRWSAELPWPHLLEWNLFNSILLDSMAIDFDGILCEDCPPGSDDDGPRYMEFIRNAKPKYLPRKRPVKLIVTARLERYRKATMEWLARWGVRVDRLIMAPWDTLAERNRQDMAAFKAQHFRAFTRTKGGIRPKLFVESDPRQARRISEITGELVVCPTTAECFGRAGTPDVIEPIPPEPPRQSISVPIRYDIPAAVADLDRPLTPPPGEQHTIAPVIRGPRATVRCDVLIPYDPHNLRWTAEAVESTLNQAWADPVIHLVADQVPLNAAHHLLRAKFGKHPNVRWYETTRQLGPYRIANSLFDRLETPWFAIQDSDDISAPNRLWRSIAILEYGWDIVGGAMEQFVDYACRSEDVLKELECKPLHVSGVYWPHVPGGTIIHGTMAIRREFFERLNGYGEFTSGGDTEFISRAHAAGVRAYVTDQIFGWRRIHDDSLWHTMKKGMDPSECFPIEKAERFFAEWKDGCDLRSYGRLDKYRGGELVVRIEP